MSGLHCKAAAIEHLNQQKLYGKLVHYEDTMWINHKLRKAEEGLAELKLGYQDMLEAERRWERFAPLLKKLFPETMAQQGLVESELIELKAFQKELITRSGADFEGSFMLKCDSQLPIAGSIKARGGIYEVLKYAEALAVEKGLLSYEEDYSKLLEPGFREFFGQYTLAVGSTGNLGLSIGISGRSLGFQVKVHMSADAKQWKKELLRSKGAVVLEYESDYSAAVEQGRRLSEEDPFSYFVDDENSKDLFLGYSTASLRLKQQLEERAVAVDEEHPLFVYLPCGVGGAPGGICFGLKQVFGDAVHCFFVEPTHSPCMLLGLSTGLHNEISVKDIGLDNRTEADGLAVGRPSGFVGKTIEKLLSGIYTINDPLLYKLLALLYDCEGLNVEPSAAAGLYGPVALSNTAEGQSYLKAYGLEPLTKQGTHIAWATGGVFVPEELKQSFYQRGKELLRSGRLL